MQQPTYIAFCNNLHFASAKNNPELKDLLPPLTNEEYKQLEKNIIENGFDRNFSIMEWHGYIVDGHNRYSICKKHNLEPIIGTLAYDTKEEVMRWMLDIQLGRRNLSPIQRIAVAEKYRPIYEKQARKNQLSGLKQNQNTVLQNSSKRTEPIDVRAKLAKTAGVSTDTYSKGKKILDSDNKELKQKVLSGEKSINAGYKELMNRNKKSISKEKESITPKTPEQKIIEFDDRMNEIDREISSLRTERESLMRRRSSLFESLDIECELKYEFVDGTSPIDSRDCRFYIGIDGHKQIFIECSVFSETPFAIYTSQVPEKYKNDFLMLWKKAHLEEKEHYNRAFTEWYEKNGKNNETKLTNDSNKDKEFYKKCFRILAKNFHPDNGDGNMEDMQCLNQLKVMWGI